MASMIRRISVPTEFILVLLICFWWSIPAGIAGVAGLFTDVLPPIEMNDGRVVTMVVVELVALAIVSWIGFLRGWSLWSFGMRPTWKGTGIGILLAAAVALTVGLVGVLANFIAPDTVTFAPPPGSLSLWAVILLSVVNPIFEETIESGYFINRLERRGMWSAVLASASFRTFLHLYGGVTAIITILPLGVIFGLVYWRRRDLWPLIVAHALFGFFSLVRLVDSG
jgi:membrane protease YdiL (CAAX protease family)